MSNGEIDKIVSERVGLKIEELKHLPANDLLALPSCSGTKFEVCGKLLELWVYHDSTEDGEALIVAQCQNTYFLGIGKMCAMGFVLTNAGTIIEAPEELMWEFT